MLEISLVERPRRQQDDAWIVASRQIDQGISLRTKEWRQPLHVGATKQIGQHVRNERAILQRIPRSRRSLSPIGQHPPLPIRGPRQIHCQKMKVCLLRNRNARQRPQKRRIRIQQFRWYVPALHQPLRPVKIFQKQVQQVRALHCACFDITPLRSRNQQRDQVDSP